MIPCQIFFFRTVFGKYFARAIKFGVMNDHSQAMNSVAHPSLANKMTRIQGLLSLLSISDATSSS